MHIILQQQQQTGEASTSPHYLAIPKYKEQKHRLHLFHHLQIPLSHQFHLNMPESLNFNHFYERKTKNERINNNNRQKATNYKCPENTLIKHKKNIIIQIRILIECESQVNRGIINMKNILMKKNEEEEKIAKIRFKQKCLVQKRNFIKLVKFVTKKTHTNKNQEN